MWTGFSLFPSRYAGTSVLTPYDVSPCASRPLRSYSCLFAAPARQERHDLRLWLLATLGSLLYCLFVYTGFAAPAAHGAILPGMQPFLISAILLIVDGTRPNRMRSFGLLCIALGIPCAATPYFHGLSPAIAFGDLLIFTGSVLWAIYSVLAKRWGYSPWTLTCAAR